MLPGHPLRDPPRLFPIELADIIFHTGFGLAQPDHEVVSGDLGHRLEPDTESDHLDPFLEHLLEVALRRLLHHRHVGLLSDLDRHSDVRRNLMRPELAIGQVLRLGGEILLLAAPNVTQHPDRVGLLVEQRFDKDLIGRMMDQCRKRVAELGHLGLAEGALPIDVDQELQRVNIHLGLVRNHLSGLGRLGLFLLGQLLSLFRLFHFLSQRDK